MRKIVLIYTFLLFSIILAFSANKHGNISTKGIAEGLAVYAITQDSTGMMWLATEAGLCSYDGYELRQFDGKRIGMVKVLEISGDTLFIGGTKGLFKFLLSGKTYLDETAFEDEQIRTKYGEWIGTDKGLYHEGVKFGTITDVYNVSHIDDNIYVGTINSLYRIRDGKEKLVLDDCLLVSQLLEIEDAYILGTAKNLIYLDKQSLKVKDQTEFPVVKTILCNDSQYFIGTDEGLYTIDDNKDISIYNHNTSLPTMSLAGDVVWCIFADKENNIWIGTDNGVSIIPNMPIVDWLYISEITDSTHGNNIDCLLEDSQSRLWLGGTNGIICVEGFKTRYPKSRWYRMGDPIYRITHNRIRDIYEDSAGRVWVCSDGGLSLYDESTGKMENIAVRNSDPTWTYCIYEDDKGNLRVEMADSIYTLDTHSLELLDKEPKLKSHKKKYLYQDIAGRKWFPSQQSDLIYTCGIDRVGFSSRRRMIEDSIPKQVIVTSVLINGKGYADDASVGKGRINLKYDENSLSVNFSDFNYDSENLNQYYYMIEGLNKEWIPIPVGENKIAISYLPIGINNLYISSSKEKISSPQLSIHISPPWYLSIPMMILYVVLFVVLIAAIVVYFVQRNTIRQEKEQKARVIEQAKQKENILQQELVVTAKNKEATADTEAYDDSLLRKITKVIEDNMENTEFSPSMLSEIMDINQKQIYRKIKFLTGMTTVEYIRHLRLDHAAQLLSSGNFTIAEVMYRVGFSNASYFSRSFLAQHGVSPKDYKKSQSQSQDGDNFADKSDKSTDIISGYHYHSKKASPISTR